MFLPLIGGILWNMLQHGADQRCFLIGDSFSGDCGFELDDCQIDSAWELSEGYSIAVKDVAVDG